MLRARLEGRRDGLAAAEAQASGGGRSRLRVAQATDVADWLAHDPLIELDRRPMAHGALFSGLWHRAHVSGRPSAGGVFDNPSGPKRGHIEFKINTAKTNGTQHSSLFDCCTFERGGSPT